MDSSPWPAALGAALASIPTFTGTDWIFLIVLLLALLLAATSAAAETALTSVSRIKVRNLAEEGDARAKRILRLLEQPQMFLSTILVVSNVSVILASTMATLLAVSLFASVGEVASTILLSLIVLIFCEITPKTAAVQAPETWARVLVGPVETMSKLLRWLIATLTWITSGIVRLLGGQTVRRGPFVTEEELRLLVEVGEEEGVLEEEEREMIHNVFELADTAVREVMVPRIDMVTVEADATVDEAMSLIVQGGQSRIPVYDNSIDNIIGVLYAKDLLRIFASGQQPATVRNLVRPAYFVPESKRLDDLLRELQQQRVHMAIVVDEYGAVAGLVTIEDLVEEIIGDIQDEYDKEEQLFEKLGENEFIVDAKISLDDFNELLDTELTGQGYETLGGYVYTQLDKIPTVGDTVTFENLIITVIGTKGRRVTKIKVVRHVDDESEEHDGETDYTELPPPSGPPLALPAPAADEQPRMNDSPAITSEPSTPHSSGTADADGYSRPLRLRSTSTRRHGHGAVQSRRHG
ncbi:MAG TPA: hemolysin family protein [Ktedonobacterales bacterium]|nr:hemolysin family protein [Ktedonobacterales bacterium]